MNPARAGGRGPRRVVGELEQTLVICALIGTAQMTWGVVVPVLPLYVDAFGIGVAVLGAIVSAFAVGRVVANVPAGLALRRLPPRGYLSVVLLALAATTAATGLAASVPALLVARFVAGVLGGAAVTIAFSVLLAGADTAQRGRVIAMATVVQMSAAAAGSVLGGIVLSVADARTVFVVAALPVLLALGWERLRPATRYWAAFRADHEPSRPRFGRAGALLLLAGLGGVSFATFFTRFAGEQGLVPVLAYDSGGLDPVGLGIALAAGTLASLAIVPLVGRLVDAGARRSILLPSAALAGVSLLALEWAHTPLVFGVLVVLYSASTSALNIVPGVVTAERFPPARVGGVVGFTRTVGDAGAAVGPLVVFGLADVAGTLPALALGGVVLFAAVLLLAAGVRRPGGVG